METLNLKISGLFTSPNQMSAVPEGALNVADNIVIDKPSIGESRRGQSIYSSLDGTPDKMFSYRGTLLVHYLDSIAYDSDGNGTFVSYSGTFDSPDSSVKIRSLEANRNLYITTSTGIKKLDSVTGDFRDSGVVQALSGTATLTNPGFMSDQVQVAYRLVWGYVDANNNEIVGAPSQRLVVINDTGDTADVTMTWQIPEEIDTTYFYRVYRSGESAGVDSPPDDELQQVKEGSPTTGEITAGAFTFTDIVPNALRGASLYTDPSQEGILQSNDQPPFALDMALFKNCVFYFNTKSKNRFFFTLIAVGDNTLGGSFGYQTNPGTTHTSTTIDGLTKKSAITIGDLTYTADTAGVAGNDISIEYTGGGTAGAEVVTVTGSAISVQIQSGVSTSNDIKTAVNLVGAATALVDLTGGSGAAQVITAQTFLEDGFDTTYLNVGMRVVGTGVQSGTTIVSIDSISAITVTPATTASATVALVFQDAFRINDMTYWAASTSDYTNRQFIAQLSGTPAENIEATAINLVAAINQDPNNSLVYAYYESGATDLPGQILLEERGIGGDEFAITSTNGESFSPILSNTGTSDVSDNDAHVNRVYISKVQQPEAVPILQFLTVGSENFPITRGLAIGESLFVFKEKEGIFRITGTDTSNFTVSIFDRSASLRCPESAVVLNNQVFCFADQGITVISESGTQIISIPIEGTLLHISSSLFPDFETASFGVSYETDRKYIFWTLSAPSDQYPTQAFVFNTITNAFTRWDLTRSCGLVLDSDNKLYTGLPDPAEIYKERKNFNRTDYADDEYNIVITDTNDDEITFTIASEKDSSDFSTSSGFGEVTTGADITFGDGVTIVKTTNGFEDGGIFGTTGAEVDEGDVITFNFMFSNPGSGFETICVLSNDSDLTQFGDYRVGLDCYFSSGQYWLTVRDDGANVDDNIQNVQPDTLYNIKYVINGDGTMSCYFKESTETSYTLFGTNLLINTNSMIGQTLYLMCSVFEDDSTVQLFNFFWTSVSQEIPDNLVGDLIKQGGQEVYIEEDLGNGTVVVSNIYDWDLGPALLYEGIDLSLSWVPNTASNPGILKQFPECTVFFKSATFRDIVFGFQTNLKTAFNFITLMSPPGNGWGEFAWGESPWGLPATNAAAIRTYVPLEMQRGSWINFKVNMRQAFSNFSLTGISAIYNEMTSRQR